MLQFTDYNVKASPKQIPDLITPKILQFPRKTKFRTLSDYQRYKTLKIKKPDGHKYQFKFELSIEDTAMSQKYLYLKNFDTLPKNKTLLWICSVNRPKSRHLQTAKISDLDWHCIEVDAVEEFTKHKGLVQCLSKNDILISAGEFYITGNEIQYNHQTGMLKKCMSINEEIMGTGFLETVLVPIFNTFKNFKFTYNKNILKDHTPPADYNFCNYLHKKKLIYKSSKHKICKCR